MRHRTSLIGATREKPRPFRRFGLNSSAARIGCRGGAAQAVHDRHAQTRFLDGLDVDAWHLFAYGEGEQRPALAGYLRVLLPGRPDESETDVRIGRVLTTAGFRGLKLGNAMLERALALCSDNKITESDLYLTQIASKEKVAPLDGALGTRGLPLHDFLDHVEREAIVKALEATRFNKTAAAKILGIDTTTLQRKRKRYGLA